MPPASNLPKLIAIGQAANNRSTAAAMWNSLNSSKRA
jgi:hypothetical protein